VAPFRRYRNLGDRKGVAALLPGDMLTTSASGLDPDISIAAAIRQAPRAAAARSIPEEKVQT